MQKEASSDLSETQTMGTVLEEMAARQCTKRKVKHSSVESSYVPVEHGGDASFSDGDGLLLHGFVYRDPVLVPHLIELRGRGGRSREVRRGGWNGMECEVR